VPDDTGSSNDGFSMAPVDRTHSWFRPARDRALLDRAGLRAIARPALFQVAQRQRILWSIGRLRALIRRDGPGSSAMGQRVRPPRLGCRRILLVCSQRRHLCSIRIRCRLQRCRAHQARGRLARGGRAHLGDPLRTPALQSLGERMGASRLCPSSFPAISSLPEPASRSSCFHPSHWTRSASRKSGAKPR
jgi:hypothetical protein